MSSSANYCIYCRYKHSWTRRTCFVRKPAGLVHIVIITVFTICRLINRTLFEITYFMSVGCYYMMYYTRQSERNISIVKRKK